MLFSIVLCCVIADAGCCDQGDSESKNSPPVRTSARAMNDAELASLVQTPDLRRLVLENSQITDLGLSRLKEIKQLK